jgi:hypothetical protein
MSTWNISLNDAMCSIIRDSKDYTWRCDCEAEGCCGTLSEARAEAKRHLKNHPATEPTEVFIDEYDHGEGELTGRYFKLNNLKK